MTRPTTHSTAPDTPTLAVVLSRQLPDQDESDVAASLAELEKLLEGLGIQVVHRLMQKRRASHHSAFVGTGKQKELEALLTELRKEHGDGAVLLAVDAELRPRQQRQLEAAVEAQVIDRTAVVLRIFEQRARTTVARLEIEIARLAYEAPRVREDESLGDREGGGGRGGRGHSNVELEKQRIRERLAALRRELEEHAIREVGQRSARGDALRVALVGYTNAGKSSLMRALTDSDVLVEDKLFATLGTTVRALSPQTAPPIVVSDTVGFIRNLPHELVASFRSTLAEAREADLLLHVVDASDAALFAQMRVARDGMKVVGAVDVPELVVLNKVDRLTPERRAELASALPRAIQLSALDPADIERLREAIAAAVDDALVGEKLDVPFAEGRLLAEIKSRARVIEEEYGNKGVEISVRALPADLERWKKRLPRT